MEMGLSYLHSQSVIFLKNRIDVGLAESGTGPIVAFTHSLTPMFMASRRSVEGLVGNIDHIRTLY